MKLKSGEGASCGSRPIRESARRVAMKMSRALASSRLGGTSNESRGRGPVVTRTRQDPCQSGLVRDGRNNDTLRGRRYSASGSSSNANGISSKPPATASSCSSLSLVDTSSTEERTSSAVNVNPADAPTATVASARAFFSASCNSDSTCTRRRNARRSSDDIAHYFLANDPPTPSSVPTGRLIPESVAQGRRTAFRLYLLMPLTFASLALVRGLDSTNARAIVCALDILVLPSTGYLLEFLVFDFVVLLGVSRHL